MTTKWSRVFCIAVAAVSLLVSGAAAMDRDEAGTSSSGAPERPPSLSNYHQSLSAERIDGLRSTYARNQGRWLDTLPFYGNTPLYWANTPKSDVEQALRDHQSVGVVEPQQVKAALIKYKPPTRTSSPVLPWQPPAGVVTPGQLSQERFPDPQKVVRVFDLEPVYHQLKKALVSRAHYHLRPSEPESVDDVLHYRGVPILTEDHDTFAHMFTASRRGEGAFWVEGEDEEGQVQHRLMRPHEDHMVELPTRTQQKDIFNLQSLHEKEKLRYGTTLASLKNGRPLSEISELAQAHPPRTSELPILQGLASRRQMVDTLARYGGFKIEIQDAFGQMRTLLVKLKRARTSTSSGGLSLPIEDPSAQVKKATGLLSRIHL